MSELRRECFNCKNYNMCLVIAQFNSIYCRMIYEPKLNKSKRGVKYEKNRI